MTLSEHLGELRRRLVICLVAFTVAAIATYVFYPHLLTLARRPLCHADPAHCTLIFTSPLEGFGFRLNAVGVGGLVFASPVILYQLWLFVTPGLRANEKRYAVPFVLASVMLFFFGAFIAWLTLPHALGFLIGVAGPGTAPLLTISKYFSLVLALMAIFGLTFEFPVVLVALELAGSSPRRQLASWRRIAIIVIVIVAGVITPSSDPFSMLALAVPMLVFYEGSILIGRLPGSGDRATIPSGEARTAIAMHRRSGEPCSVVRFAVRRRPPFRSTGSSSRRSRTSTPAVRSSSPRRRARARPSSPSTPSRGRSPAGAGRSTRPRSKRSRIRSTATSSASTDPSASDCSPGTSPATATRQSSS